MYVLAKLAFSLDLYKSSGHDKWLCATKYCGGRGKRWRLLVVPMLFVGHPMLLIGLACAAHSSCRCCTVVVPVPLFLQMNRSVLEYAVRCMCRCSALRCPMERAAFSGREDSRAWGGMTSGLARQSLHLPGVPATRPHGAVGIFALPPRNASRAVLPFFCKSRGQAHAVAWPGLVGVLRRAEWLPVRGVGMCQSSLR